MIRGWLVTARAMIVPIYLFNFNCLFLFTKPNITYGVVELAITGYTALLE